MKTRKNMGLALVSQGVRTLPDKKVLIVKRDPEVPPGKKQKLHPALFLIISFGAGMQGSGQTLQHFLDFQMPERGVGSP